MPTQRGEQTKKCGVYKDVFDQSILIPNRTKSWSFFASASAELVAITLAVLIPLARTNHLPDFHWQSVRVAAPARPPEPQPVVTESTGSAIHSISPRRIFIPRTGRSSLGDRTTSTEFVSIDPPGAINLGGPPPAEGIQLETFTTMPTVPEPSHPLLANAPPGPIRVSTGAQMAKLLKKVIPEYPPLAKAARISGVVHLLGVISKDGTIQNLQVIGGHPLLTRAALDAVRQWIYQPTLLNGQPVEVIAPIDVHFTLGR